MKVLPASSPRSPQESTFGSSNKFDISSTTFVPPLIICSESTSNGLKLGIFFPIFSKNESILLAPSSKETPNAFFKKFDTCCIPV